MMSQTYAQSRIRNALKENQGSPARTRQMVMRWALEDPKLMAELVAPHLSGIVAYAISRVEGGETLPVPPAQDEAGDETAFGMELLRHVAGDHAAVFGQESGLLPARKPGVSQDHIDAINLLAAKGQAKTKTKSKK